MPKETTADFLNNLTEDKVDLFKEPVLSEEKEIDELKEEKRLPFNKDPKVQRYISDEIAKRLEFVKPSAEQSFRREVTEELDLPPALVKLVGNDTPEKREALKGLADHLASLTDKAQEKFVQKMQEQEEQSREEDNAALSELNQGFEDIEDSYGVDISSNAASAQRTRAAFVEYLRKVSHKNADGEVDQFADIPAAWEEFQERNKPQSNQRSKELAARGMTRSTDTSSAPKAGNSWKDVERYFSTLKKTN